MYNLNYRRTIMNKAMILATLVAYKAFNDKSLTIRTNEYVVDGANIDSIDSDNINVSAWSNIGIYSVTININDITGIQFQSNMSDTNIDYEDIYDNIDDYEYPYNHINKGEL